MANSISPQGLPPASAIPGPQLTWGEILEEYPELTEQVAALTGWRDVGQPDKRDKGFEKRYPDMRPRP